VDFREFLGLLESAGNLESVTRQVDPCLELAALVDQLGERPVQFFQVAGSPHTLVAGLCSSRDWMAAGLGVPKQRLLFALARALRNPITPPLLEEVAGRPAPCHEVVRRDFDLRTLPILTHLPGDGGAYVTAGIAVVRDPKLGRNVSYHRLMRLDRKRFAIRIVKHRGTYMALERAGGELDIAVCIGNSPAVLLAAAMSPAPGVDELSIAHALTPTPLARCLTIDAEVPAGAEFVLEGRITREMVDEGPFLDLTETMDIVRCQPVLEISCITHRHDAIYQALLPGGLEHKLLMGIPREPTIYEQVNEVCRCTNVLLTPGGGSWLHGVVQISKSTAEDGQLAIEAAFRGHSSLKHVLIVDDDIDIYDPSAVEWAVATRFQADKDLAMLPDQPGSSLDPSSLRRPGHKSRTSKMGLDATIPWLKPTGELRTEEERAAFRRVRYQAERTGSMAPQEPD